jgi:hypothetical protein
LTIVLQKKYRKKKTPKNIQFAGFKILQLISKDILYEKTKLSKKLLFIAQKLRITFDTLVLGRKDFPIFHEMAGKSQGTYCRPMKNFFRLTFTEEFIDILIALFLPFPFLKQFMILPFSTKTLNLYNFFSSKQHQGFFCYFCSSIYNNLPTNCYFCGINFIN